MRPGKGYCTGSLLSGQAATMPTNATMTITAPVIQHGTAARVPWRRFRSRSRIGDRWFESAMRGSGNQVLPDREEVQHMGQRQDADIAVLLNHQQFVAAGLLHFA